MNIVQLQDKILRSAGYENCRKCRCFHETLDTIGNQLSGRVDRDSVALLEVVKGAVAQLVIPEYT